MNGVRQQINENKKLGIGVAAGIVVVALVLMGFQMRGPSDAAADNTTKAFYTDDNGKSFFKDDINKVVPFDHNGRQAYRADVFRGADGKQFVGLIYRHTDAGRKEIETFFANKTKDAYTRKSIEQRGMQVKRAGADDKSWQLNDEATTERLQTSVKDSSGKVAELVTP